MFMKHENEKMLFICRDELLLGNRFILEYIVSHFEINEFISVECSLDKKNLQESWNTGGAN